MYKTEIHSSLLQLVLCCVAALKSPRKLYIPFGSLRSARVFYEISLDAFFKCSLNVWSKFEFIPVFESTVLLNLQNYCNFLWFFLPGLYGH